MPDRRKKKLILPRLQFRITLAFMATAVVVLATMGSLVTWLLSSDRIHVPPGAEPLLDQVHTILAVAFGMTMLLLVPLTIFVGLRVTHIVAGPVHRFDVFLNQVLRGERPPDCRLRHGDELQEICALINEATRPLREHVVEAEEPAEGASKAA